MITLEAFGVAKRSVNGTNKIAPKLPQSVDLQSVAIDASLQEKALQKGRTIANCPRGTVINIDHVPIMMSADENDGFLIGINKTSNEHRPQSILSPLALTTEVGHSLGELWDMVLDFINTVLAWRLPPVSST